MKRKRRTYLIRPGDPGYVEGVTTITKECQLAQGRQLQISHLPIEDTVWSIDRVIDKTDTTDVMLVIQDRCSLVVGFTVWDTSATTLSDHVYLALCTACLFPVVHRPRRPRYFSFRDKYLAKICMSDVDGLGITCIMGPDRTICQMPSHSVIASTDTPPVVTSTGTPPVVTSTDTPPVVTSTGTPPVITSTGTPPVLTSTDTPPVITSTDTPPVITSTGTPPVVTSTDAPPVVTSTGTPPVITSTGTPPVLTSTDTPPVITSTGTPPVVTSTDAPPVVTSTDIPPVVTSTDTPPVLTSTDAPPLFRECNVCHFRAEKEVFHTCEGCGAMLYCTQACQETDWGQEGQTTLYNHSKWCHRLKLYMEEEKQLIDLPFTFTSDTTHPDFGVQQLEAFLQRIGLFGRGLWQWVCPVTSGLPVTQTHGTGFFKDHQNPFLDIKENACSTEGLPENNSTQGSQSSESGTKLDPSEDPCSQVDRTEDSESSVSRQEISYTKVDQSESCGIRDQLRNHDVPMDQSGDACAIGDQLRNRDVPVGQSGFASTPLTDWANYYKHKGFSFDSPIAVLLQWPLTLYYILTSCLPQDYGCGLAEDRPVILDILGVEQEVDLYPVFQELGNLLPGHDFVINLFGKNISKVVDRCVKVMGRVKIKVYRCLYHNYKGRWKPDLAIGFNAGIAAYPSWRDTIRKLKDEQIPAYFTDYCHYSADLGREVVREGCYLETSTPSVNPFRSPMRRVCEQHLLPWFSNAFIFHLIYSPIKQS
ncbi:uncharacterized protein LOC110465597 isoform X2 [Mizuhopecten yessoensis]|uniref:uncharacterized protein LOC110465597 isoform X2 n=1 Tax=Mizuhopecten yessoensis TaxID=6573 RepID=UPI000B45E499|nr:uncharacterized protein LOC110465597 isoform X2 [Mizuhopecten yessoensis]